MDNFTNYSSILIEQINYQILAIANQCREVMSIASGVFTCTVTKMHIINKVVC